MGFFKIELLSKTSNRYLLIVFSMLAIFSSQVQAIDKASLGLGASVLGVVDDHKIICGCIEYRPAFEMYKMSPWISIEFAEDIFYAAVGIRMNFNLTDDILLTPSFGVGFFSENNRIELGSPIEFRSAIELGYRFNHSGQLGISFGHISNGGLDGTNPGSETLKISYYFPLGSN